MYILGKYKTVMANCKKFRTYVCIDSVLLWHISIFQINQYWFYKRKITKSLKFSESFEIFFTISTIL